jgi:hypothetical protein
MAVQTMNLLSMIRGVRIEDDDTQLTPEEWERVKKSEKSGTCKDIDKLLNYLDIRINGN